MGSWLDCIDSRRWDYILSRLGGHPLQSALWGKVRRKVDQIDDLLLEYQQADGNVGALARVEIRNIPLLGKIAWLPKGPAQISNKADSLEASLGAELKRRGFIACISDPYCIPEDNAPTRPRTIWLDLTLGIEVLSKNLDQQWRYGARRAMREGVSVRTTVETSDIEQFYRMCEQLSNNKGFVLPGSEAQMVELISAECPSSAIGMILYVGDVKNEMAGGAVVARCGSHLHYFWGASDRRFSKYRVNEALQWKIIQDGVASGMTRYDLEGIDPLGNPGVYQFKKKMGGREVALFGHHAVPLSPAGCVAVSVGRHLGKI